MDKDKGIDPNSVTGTKDAVDPGTGAIGTAGTPVTAGYGVSGSTVGTGSGEGEQKFESGDYTGSTPETKEYTTGVHGAATEDALAGEAERAREQR